MIEENFAPAPPPGRNLNAMERGIELSVFVFLILPSLLLYFVLKGSGQSTGPGFAVDATAIIFRDLSLMSLVVFFLWRNGEPFLRIGWDFRRSWREAGLGVVLFFPMFAAAMLVEQAAQSAGLSAGPKSLPAAFSPHGQAELTLAAVLVVVVAFTEETIFRGYLILRLRETTGSGRAAVLLSCVIFSLGHGYEGTAGVVTVGFLGLVFAFMYLWRKSLVAPMVMHGMQDFLGIVLAPLLGMR